MRASRLVLVIAAGVAASQAWAADGVAPPPPASGWIVTLGISPAIAPRYDGARLYGLSGSPAFDFRRAGEPKAFSSPDDGFDLTLFGNDRFAVGPVFSIRGGRYRSADRSLYGLRDVPWTVEGGVFADFWPIKDRLRTRVELRHGFRGRSDGFVGDFSIDWVQPFGRLTLSGGPRLTLADSDYMDANFGVLPGEAQANGRVMPFDPRAGGKSVGFEAALAYEWSPAWTTTAFLRYDRLVADAAKSPIVREFGSPNQFTIGTVLSYSFAIGQ